MLDKEGYRPNVGIVLANQRNEVFWGKRVNQHAWQFPQGGINYGETPVQAMYRELEEEIGLQRTHVRSEDHTSELQSHSDLVCRLLLEKKKKKKNQKKKK